MQPLGKKKTKTKKNPQAWLLVSQKQKSDKSSSKFQPLPDIY